ncbi:MAG: oligosaccharide flippase family protein [Lachnospiraceae bacterium]|nr:oligosaccharide flippase family protein [Lachnospiraceae bacterium]
MKIKPFFLESKNIERSSYTWNMAGSMLSAFQSVIMLMILTRTLGLKDAGIFTIAFANANLFLSIGKYGMRYFQVSDVRGQFSFAEYKSSRIFTTAAMILVSAGYVLFVQRKNAYTLEKSMTIIWMCLLKVVDAVEDVYHGFYQQKNRLDMAGKGLTLRLGVTIVVFGVGLIVLRRLLTSLIIATVVSFLVFLFLNRWMIKEFQSESGEVKKGNLFLLLKLCFPLFLGSFLSFYIGNAPKYAIDAMLTDEMQACYGFIAMPVFVIGLLNGFIFNPVIHKVSVLWNEGRMREFMKMVARQIGIIAIITMICIVGAYFLGVPVLSWLYNTDLSPFKTELLILLLGGGFHGLAGFLNTMNTVIRQQKLLMWGYAVIAAAAYLCSDLVVGEYGMFGAAVLYMGLMIILSGIFFVVFMYGMRKFSVSRK